MFEDNVLLFSAKDCRMPSTGNRDTDWSRWYRTAIERSAAQLWGAEKWLRSSRAEVFIDAKCSVRLPIDLPDATRMRIHLIAVADDSCRVQRGVLGLEGRLAIVPSLVGEGHIRTHADGGVRFAIGRIGDTKRFVHVVDHTSLESLLGALDTVTDLTTYLVKKEALIASGRLGRASSEEALLGLYLSTRGPDGSHDFATLDDNDQGQVAVVDEGHWQSYRETQDEKHTDTGRASDLWDSIIERWTAHVLDLTVGVPDGGARLAGFERSLRFMARQDRATRELLSRVLLLMRRATPADLIRVQVVQSTTPGNPFWVFVLYPFPHNLASAIGRRLPLDEYKRLRGKYLWCCMHVVKLLFPEANDIVGYATEAGSGDYGSDGILYLDARHWNEKDAAFAREARSNLDIPITRTSVFDQVLGSRL